MTQRRFRSVVSASVLALGVGMPAGCGNGDDVPDRLMDGSEPSALPVELQGIEQPAVMTASRVVPSSQRQQAERSASCLKRGRGDPPVPTGASVERIGVHSETVTFLDDTGRAIFGCDNSEGPREENRRWCGGAYGQLFAGRLRDPRLGIGCVTEDDEKVGFVWVQPGRNIRYVSVEQPGYVEVYEVAGRLPVRIATRSGVRVEGSRATFDVFEHDSDGRLVRRYRLEAVVAG